MKILVLGAGGMAGHAAAIYLCEKGHEVVGFSRSPLSYCENVTGDALDREAVKSALRCKKFDAVINCIGILNKEVDKNLSAGIYINSFLPNFIKECLKDTPTKFIQLSTDCVFSGRTGGYEEDSLPDSASFYGRTKALGEVNDGKNLTIRTSIVGPDRKGNGVGLLNWFLSQKGAVRGFTSAIWTGVSTITLAKAFERAVEDDLCGLYQLVNGDTISKYELLGLFNRYLREKPVEIRPDDSVHVDKSLVSTRTDFDFKVPSYEQMVKEMREWILNHKALYRHYFLG